jgi:hypothetical protein
MGRKIAVEINRSRFAVLGLSIPADVEALSFEINIPPGQAQRLHFASPIVSEQFEEVGQHHTVRPGSFSLIDKLLKLFRR